MNNPINKNNKQTTFSKDGFIFLKNFLQMDEISIVQNEIEIVIECGRESTCVRPNNTLLPLRWNDKLIELFLNSEHRIVKLKEAVKAQDLKWISGYISSKEPHCGALWWHQDWWCWQHAVSFKKAPTQIALMCYLTATNENNGALRVLPGSHHKISPLHSVLPEAHAEDTNHINQDQIAMKDYSDQITLNLNAGDAIAIDYRLLHGTHENISDSRRDCVMLTFTPSWADLPNDIKGHLSRHYALPFENEFPIHVSYQNDLIPTYNGIKKDLNVNRIPPKDFIITD
jgi:ectoine hydroxylase-related dioxygenase (phytanoyl-CoA dioxygenase family)